MNKRKKKSDCIMIETVQTPGKESLDINLLQNTVEYFKDRPSPVQDNFHSPEDLNKFSTEDHIHRDPKESSHSFDLLKQANEKYNTLRNTVLLDILEKYKNNADEDFLSYEYLFKSIMDSYKLLDEYDAQAYNPSIPKSVYLDNQIRVHNLVMKLICGSKQIDHAPSSMVVPLPDNLGEIMNYFWDSGGFKDLKIQTDVIYSCSTSTASDPRYLLFLKRTSPALLKFCGSPEEYIQRQEDLVKDKGKINEARSKKGKLTTLRGLVSLDGISQIEDVRWSKKDLKKFAHCVIKHKNNFQAIGEVLPHIPRKDLIKKYYLSKDKTYYHIKKKPGRISDSEIKKIVEKEWSQAETNLFVEKYKTYGKNLVKYQAWIDKSEKDLKIFLRYFLKTQKGLKHEVVPRTSISKEDLLNCWSIDERQIFAIYFPYFNKNWITMATYFPKKTSSDLKLYYSKYFKTLSYNEQKFEASISNLKVKFGTYPVVHIGDETHEDEILLDVGIVFKK